MCSKYAVMAVVHISQEQKISIEIMRTEVLLSEELKRTKTQTTTPGEQYLVYTMAPSYDKCVERLEKINAV